MAGSLDRIDLLEGPAVIGGGALTHEPHENAPIGPDNEEGRNSNEANRLRRGATDPSLQAAGRRHSGEPRSRARCQPPQSLFTTMSYASASPFLLKMSSRGSSGTVMVKSVLDPRTTRVFL